jgi:hypothetical protein
MSKIIVSFSASGRENYPRAQLRLIKSIVDTGWTGGQLHRCFDGYCDQYSGVDIKLGEYPVTKAHGLCPHHSQTPYAFKPYLIQEAIEQGAEQIIWCDSTMILVADPQPLLDYAAVHGVCSFNNDGFPLKDWISDVACQRMGISEAELEGMKQIMSCAFVLDITNPTGRLIFNDWMALAIDGGAFQNNGSDRPGFRAHRHDQAVMSALINQYNVPILPYGQLCYDGLQQDYENVIFINKGL